MEVFNSKQRFPLRPFKDPAYTSHQFWRRRDWALPCRWPSINLDLVYQWYTSLVVLHTLVIAWMIDVMDRDLSKLKHIVHTLDDGVERPPEVFQLSVSNTHISWTPSSNQFSASWMNSSRRSLATSTSLVDPFTVEGNFHRDGGIYITTVKRKTACVVQQQGSNLNTVVLFRSKLIAQTQTAFGIERWQSNLDVLFNFHSATNKTTLQSVSVDKRGPSHDTQRLSGC